MNTYSKTEALEKEEINIHLIEDMVYIPPMKNGNWFVKDEYRERINEFWRHSKRTFMSGMYQGLP